MKARRRPICALPLLCLLWGGLTAALWGCGEEKPPAPDRPPSAEVAEQKAGELLPDAAAIFTFAGERGEFADTNDRAKIPDAAKGMVRVKLLDGPPPPPGAVWVANLKQGGEGPVALATVPRDQFEEYALGDGRSSAVDLPEGLEPPENLAPSGDIIVYKTDWCGVCKKLTAYLDRKGVDYVAKDIEKERDAAAELQAKAAKAGVPTGSVPIIDVRGELMVGFDRARLEELL